MNYNCLWKKAPRSLLQLFYSSDNWYFHHLDSETFLHEILIFSILNLQLQLLVKKEKAIYAGWGVIGDFSQPDNPKLFWSLSYFFIISKALVYYDL